MMNTHPLSLLGALTTAEADSGDGAAVRVGADALSRADLIAAASAVADRVAGAAAVAINATPSLHTIVAVVGCVMAGVAAVPVPPDSGPAERKHILQDSKAELILEATLGEHSVPSELVNLSARSSERHPEPDQHATAFIMYTSGTAGPPKGVLLSRSAVAAGLDGVADAWAWTPDDVLVHGLPLFHVHGLLLGVLGALRQGSPLIHTQRPRPEAYAAARGTLYFGVPTVWSRIWSREALRYPSPSSKTCAP
jgi:fatty acid CoA ligase FadD36